MILPCSGAHGLCAPCVEQLRQTGKFDCPQCREPIEGRVNQNRSLFEALLLQQARPKKRRQRRARQPRRAAPFRVPTLAAKAVKVLIIPLLVACAITYLLGVDLLTDLCYNLISSVGLGLPLGPRPTRVAELTLTLTSGTGHF